MKFKECNKHEQLAWKLMIEQYNMYIGGLENILEDYNENDKEYQEAKETLSNHDLLKQFIYDETIAIAEQMRFAKSIKFAGKDFLMERIEKRLVKDGY